MGVLAVLVIGLWGMLGALALPVCLIWLLVARFRRRRLVAPAVAAAVAAAGVLALGIYIAAQMPRVIETATETIRADQGGTIQLPGGSRVDLPPGLADGDYRATLSLLTFMPWFTPGAEPGGLIAPVGAALSLEIAPLDGAGTAGPWPGTSVAFAADLQAQAGDAPRGDGRLPVLTVQLEQPGDVAGARVEGAVPIAAIEVGDERIVAGIPGECIDGSRSCKVAVPMPPGWNIRKLQVGLGNVRPAVESAPLPTRGAMTWTGGRWVGGTPGFDPGKRTLVLVHGMRSSVEAAFPAGCVGKIMDRGKYDQVVGFSYDWTRGVEENGRELAGFLDRLRDAGTAGADIEAHSEGVPVTLAAIPKTGLPIGNVVMLGGPIMGTPAADFGTLAQQGLAAASGLRAAFDPVKSFWATVLLHQPVAALAGRGDISLEQVLGGRFAADLAYGSPVLARVRQDVMDRMADPGSNLADTRLIPVAGTGYSASRDMWALGEALKWIGSVHVDRLMDGIIWADSALGAGSGLKLTPTPRRTYPVSHTQLQCDDDVIDDVAATLKGVPGGPPERPETPPDRPETPPEPDLPNLAPASAGAFLAGWPDNLVLSTSGASPLARADDVFDDQQLYVSWWFHNPAPHDIGKPFRVTLLLDGQEQYTWTVEALKAFRAVTLEGYPLGVLPAGKHEVRVIADVHQEVAEANETDNVLSLAFTVRQRVVEKKAAEPSAPCPFGGEWSGAFERTGRSGDFTTAFTVTATLECVGSAQPTLPPGTPFQPGATTVYVLAPTRVAASHPFFGCAQGCTPQDLAPVGGGIGSVRLHELGRDVIAQGRGRSYFLFVVNQAGEWANAYSDWRIVFPNGTSLSAFGDFEVSADGFSFAKDGAWEEDDPGRDIGFVTEVCLESRHDTDWCSGNKFAPGSFTFVRTSGPSGRSIQAAVSAGLRP